MQHGRGLNTKSLSKLRTLQEDEDCNDNDDLSNMFSSSIRVSDKDELKFNHSITEAANNAGKHFMNRNISTTITIGRKNDDDKAYLVTNEANTTTINDVNGTTNNRQNNIQNIPSSNNTNSGRRNSLTKVDSNTTEDSNEVLSLPIWFHELSTSDQDIVISNKSITLKINQIYELAPTNSNKKLYFVVNSSNLAEELNQDDSNTLLKSMNSSNFSISLLSNPFQSLLDLAPRSLITLKRVLDIKSIEIDSVEILIKDINLSRDSMWDFSSTLIGTTIYVSKRLSFNGSRSGIVNCLYKDGKKIFSGYVSENTKFIYRSESAKLTVLIQLSQEMWHFEENGEIMFHKLVNSLFPKIFKRWRDHNSHHSITIVLFSSLDLTNIPWSNLSPGERPNNRRDYFRTVVDQVNILHWERIMANLRLEFANFKRDILLNVSDGFMEGALLPSVKGNVLEAINLGLSTAVDRFRNTDLKHSLNHFMLITPGTGLFDVEYDLMLKTSLKISQMECGLDIICLSQPPLHIVPLFRFNVGGKVSHCVPNWCDISFYRDPNQTTKQWIPRCKIYELQMMGLMETDLNEATIERLQVQKVPNFIDEMDQYDKNVFRPVSRDVEQLESTPKLETPTKTASLALIFTDRSKLPPVTPSFEVTTTTTSALGTVFQSNDVSALSKLYNINKNNEDKPTGSLSVRRYTSNLSLGPGAFKNNMPKQTNTTAKVESNTEKPPPLKKKNSYKDSKPKKVKKSINPENKDPPKNLMWVEIKNPSMEVRKNLLNNLMFSRWTNVFPRKAKRGIIKWKSFQSPAALPISTPVFPSTRQLEANYTFQIYNVILNYESFLELSTPHELMREMIRLRLLLGFQICYGDQVKKVESERITTGSVQNLLRYLPENTFGSRIYMCLDDEIHRIFSDFNGSITVQLYRKIQPKEVENKIKLGQTKPETYRPLIRTRYADDYSPAKADFLNMKPQKYNWNQFDQFIAGYDDAMPNDIKKFHKMKFVVMPADIPKNAYFVNNENLTDEEVRVEGLRKLIALIEKGYYTKDKNKKNRKNEEVLPEISFYTGTLYDFLIEESETYDINGSSLMISENTKFNKNIKLEDLATELQGQSGIRIVDRVWHFRRHLHCFVGTDLVAWLLERFEDIDNREEATSYGQELFDRGLFNHVEERHGFLDGHYFYKFTKEYITENSAWFAKKKPDKSAEKTSDSNPGTPNYSRNNSDVDSTKSPLVESTQDLHKISSNLLLNDTSDISSQSDSLGKVKYKKFILSRSVKYDVDPQRLSARPEIVTVHYDKVHNPEHCYHIRLQWLNTTTKFIDETIINWSRLCARHGLKLVETPWNELCTIPELYPFHSFVEVKLAINPWSEPRLVVQKILLENPFYYHFYFLKKTDFLLDNRSTGLVLKHNIEIEYSWGKPIFKYAQFIHKSGIYIVELRENGDFFLAPNNIHLIRLSASLTTSTAIDQETLKSESLDSQRVMLNFRSACQDKEFLQEVFREANEVYKKTIVING